MLPLRPPSLQNLEVTRCLLGWWNKTQLANVVHKCSFCIAVEAMTLPGGVCGPPVQDCPLAPLGPSPGPLLGQGGLPGQLALLAEGKQ